MEGTFTACLAGFYSLRYFLDGDDIFIHGKERDPPPVFPDPRVLPPQPDGFVLDRTRVEFEAALRVIVYERPVQLRS